MGHVLNTPTMTAHSNPETSALAAASRDRQWLSFRIGEQDYAIDILSVQEVRRYEPATRIAQSAAELLGVLNLRGTIVPIVDLRLQLGASQSACDAGTVVIVLHVGTRVFGLVVDGVDEVIDLAPGQLRPLPPMADGATASLLRAVATIGGRLLQLLDIDKLMRSPALNRS